MSARCFPALKIEFPQKMSWRNILFFTPTKYAEMNKTSRKNSVILKLKLFSVSKPAIQKHIKYMCDIASKSCTVVWSRLLWFSYLLAYMSFVAKIHHVG